MSNEPYDRGLDILRDSEADEDFSTTSDVLSPDPTRGAGPSPGPGSTPIRATASAGSTTRSRRP